MIFRIARRLENDSGFPDRARYGAGQGDCGCEGIVCAGRALSHDLRVAAQICDLVAVMKDGAVVEQGLAGEVFGNPQHPYTQALLASIPGGDFTRKRDAALL
jgi:hypothetical protein